MKNLLLVIDPQNDFCKPADSEGKNGGALYVPGAHDDMVRLANWIKKNKVEIDHIIVTLDNHHLVDISHPDFWIDAQGNHPAPFSTITAQEVKDGKWQSVVDTDMALNYLEKLEAQGLQHTIWPPHCLIGSEGAAIYPPLFEAFKEWSAQGRYYQAIIKGTFPFTEHFGAFMAQVVFDEIPETRLDDELLDELGEFENIFIAGEARSHCVGTSLKQIIDYVPSIVSKITILEDAMSNVPGFEMEEVYKKAKELGAKSATTDQVTL